MPVQTEQDKRQKYTNVLNVLNGLPKTSEEFTEEHVKTAIMLFASTFGLNLNGMLHPENLNQDDVERYATLQGWLSPFGRFDHRAINMVMSDLDRIQRDTTADFRFNSAQMRSIRSYLENAFRR